MGIFTGIEVLFFWLGVMSTLSVLGIFELQKRYVLKWHAYALTTVGAFLLIFTIAWFVSGVIEGETKAANMGLLCFGVPVLIIFGAAKRLVPKKETTISSETDKVLIEDGQPS